MKSLVDLCLFCVSNNLNNINKVGDFLSWSNKEILVQRLCDHDMFCEDQLSLISKNLFTPQLRTVSFKYNDTQITDTVLASLAASGCQLSSLTLKYCNKLTDKGMTNYIKTQKELQYLSIRVGPPVVNQLTDKWLLSLKCQGLSTLILQGVDLADSTMELVTVHCPNIEEIRIVRSAKLTDSVVEVVTRNLGKKLEILDLTDARQLTDMSFVPIGDGKCPNLKELYVTGCSFLTAKTLKMIQQGCPKLVCLDMGFCYKMLMDGTLFVSMDVFPSTLTELMLYGIQFKVDQLNDLAKRLTNIRVLRLCGIMEVDDGTIESVCSSAGKTLIELDLSTCRSISDASLSSVNRHCRVLEHLVLSCCQNITGKTLENFCRDSKRANEIREINLIGCKKFSMDIVRLIVTSCPNLEALKLAGMKEVDDELLISLAANCAKLKTINLKGCDQVTDNGICELALLCPLSVVVVSGIHGLTDKSIFALTNCCTTTLEEVYASACTKITIQAFRYLKDCCVKRIYVDHKTPNLDPDQLMAKNLDTGEFCRADLELAHATTFRR